MRSIHFPPDDAPPKQPSNFVLEGDALTLRSRLDVEYFATEPDKRTCVLTNPLVLLTSKPLSALRDLIPLLEVVARQERPLLLLAPVVEGEALDVLATNKLQGRIACCPAAIRRDRDTLVAVRDFTGTRIIGDLGTRLDNVMLEDLGHVSKAVVERHQTRLWKATPADAAASADIPG